MAISASSFAAASDSEAPQPKIDPLRIALFYEELLDSGKFESRAALARFLGVSRAPVNGPQRQNRGLCHVAFPRSPPGSGVRLGRRRTKLRPPRRKSKPGNDNRGRPPSERRPRVVTDFSPVRVTDDQAPRGGLTSKRRFVELLGVFVGKRLRRPITKQMAATMRKIRCMGTMLRF